MKKALTLVEMIVALAMIVIIAAAILPQLKVINDSWASKQANAEVLQNARVFVDLINRSLLTANKITEVSDYTEINGYIEFENNDGTVYRFDIAANNYIEFGPVGNLANLAGPVSQLKFTCYSKDVFTTPTTVADDIRLVKTEVIFPNPGTGQDRTYTASTYLRTNASSGISAPVGLWEMDDTSGLTALDSTGNDYHGSLTNMAGNEWNTGIFAGAIELDGSNDYIAVPVLSDYATNLTLSMWFKSHDAGSIGNDYLSQRFISQPRSAWYSRIAVGINSNKIATYWNDGRHNVGEGTTTLSPNVWYHAALTYDGSTIKIYLDGTEENSFVESNLTAPSSSYYMQIGRQIIGVRYFDGLLDDVRIYSRALTAEEIAILADAVRYNGFTEAKTASDTTSITISTPSTYENDLLITAVATDGETSLTMTPPFGQGWTQIDIDSYMSQVTLGTWWKLADLSESETHQFTWSGNQQAYGWMMSFTGHKTSDPINVYGTNAQSNSTPTSPAVTTTVSDALVLRLGAFNGNDITEDDPGLTGHTAITMDHSSAIVAYQEFTEKKLSSNGKYVTINTPSGTKGGNLLIAAIVTDGNTEKSLTPPGGQGWNQISIKRKGKDVTLGIWWKLADASESPDHRFTWSKKQEAYGWMMRFTGHDQSSPIHKSSVKTGRSRSPQCKAVATELENCMILRIAGFDDDDVTVDNTGLSGHTDITMDQSSTGSGTCSGGAGYVLQASAGDSGTSNFSLTGTEQYISATIAIAPDSGGSSGSVSGGAGYFVQTAAGNSGTKTFTLTAPQGSQMITIGIFPEKHDEAVLP